MRNKWKYLCFILCGILFLEGAYILKLKSDEGADSWKHTAVYYGNSGKAEVQLTATRDFMQMKNIIDESGTFPYQIPLKLENNGDTFLAGTVYLYSSPKAVNDEAAMISITSDKKASVNANLWKKQKEKGDPIQELFFYLEGTDVLEIDEISYCTIPYGDEVFQVNLELFEMNQ